MCELHNDNAAKRRNDRWHLLATVSVLTLAGSAYGTGVVLASDSESDLPRVWIELGGQLSRLGAGQEVFSPAIMADRPAAFSPSQPFEKQSLYTIDETGKISVRPGNSGWTFAASIRYGRSHVNRHTYQQTTPKTFATYYLVRVPSGAAFAKTHVQNSEQHTVVDFQTGRDVGLGMFGRDSSSVFDLGVRFAQFSSKSNIALKSDPDWQFNYKYLGTLKFLKPYGGRFHSNQANLSAARNFHGIGPSLSWGASASVAGTADTSQISLDWGLNAAILFGRQKVIVHHQATGLYQHASHPESAYGHVTYHKSTTPPARSRSVAVPNVGGFAGMTFRIDNFKASAGYRADFFFGAMDGGIDSRKTYNRDFYGPFASISLGLP